MRHRTQFSASRFAQTAPESTASPATPVHEFKRLHEFERRNPATEQSPDGLVERDGVTTRYPTGSSVRYTEAEISDHSSELDNPADPEVGPGGTENPTADVVAPRRSGQHRLPAPPSALKGRAAVVAVAAGAVVAAGQAATDGPAKKSDQTEVELTAADSVVATAAPQAAQFSDVTQSASDESAPQVLALAKPTDLGEFSNLLAKGQRFSEERAAREAAARRPLFVLPATGTFTSHFGYRWGTLHAGVDIANALGTPIYAVADGEVIDAGPVSGFGRWVRLQHDDGTVTLYGHLNSEVVTVGQRVMAGDQIATMGNTGYSTGPHLHFEVHLGGANKTDPVPWLATRGISLGSS
ncbi:M23 family metallopeptidase [Rhodococcus xishaensis]|uniref:M23 family metallopeptidase n=1 Tax=Rhodococcus xishaensis TaxID=2487364 RepID=A0A3S3ZKQ6_9NOCA|nr:M23 family metallopeptidase [Rhodococcus xishaensis]RVW02963.1 M23 family metallopeptidase [Rhodococcus xishaensis]